MIFTDESYIREKLVPRKRDAYKNEFGKVLIFAGSPGMAGAAVLCGKSALKSGAGLVQYLVPTTNGSLCQILQISVPEATCISYSPEFDFHPYDAIAAGCGMGRNAENIRILVHLLKDYDGSLILDADALNAIAREGMAPLVQKSRAQVLITPHVGEAKRLLASDARIVTEEERRLAVCRLAERYSCTALLKGSGTLIAEPQEKGFAVFENTTGNPGMATGGAGDCLTGIIASLAGQGYPLTDAARMGAFLHGMAGDMAAGTIGEMGMTAMDIVSYLPKALNLYYPG